METRPGCRNWRLARRLAAAGALLLFALPGLALEPAYLGEFPDPARIVKDIQGKDRMDTLARQLGALTQLNILIKDMAGARYNTPGQYPSPDEARLRAAIAKVAEPLYEEAEATFDPAVTGMNTPRANWRSLRSSYDYDPQLYDELMRRYFSPAFRAAHAAVNADQQARIAASQEQERKSALRPRSRFDESPWKLLTDQERTNALLFGGAMLLLLVLGNVPLLLPIRFSRPEPRKLSNGLRRHQVVWVTGTVCNYRERSETEDHSFVSRWTRKDQWGDEVTQSKLIKRYVTRLYEDFLLEGDGVRQEISLNSSADGKLAPPSEFRQRQGSPVTALWTTKGKENTGHFLHFYDWRSRRNIPHQVIGRGLERLIAPRRWTLAPAFLLGYVIGSSTGLLGTIAPRGLRGFALGLVFMVAGLAVTTILARVRRWQFQRTELENLHELLKGESPTPAAG